MHVTAIDQITLSGSLTEIALTWSGPPARSGLPVTFNQGNHLRAQTEQAPAWLAGTATLPDARPDVDRVAAAVTRLLTEQDALRARFPRTAEAPTQDVYDAHQVSARPRVTGRVWHRFLAALIAERCRPGDVPGVFFAVLDDTLVCAFDHAHADALTIDLVLRRLLAYYADPATPTAPARDLTQRCIDEAAGVQVLDAGESKAALRVWEEFFDETGGTLPAFGLPLGPGRAPQRTVVVPLSGAATTDTVLGTKQPFATLLAALSGAIAETGGPSRLATLIPIHTRGRRDSGWHDTAGWLVSNAPVIVDADDPAGAQHWLRHAPTLAALPLEQVLAHCRPTFTSADISMVSYLDYRRLGPDLPGAQHISALTSTDTAQFWFTRSGQGVDLRVRYPAHPEADESIDALLAALRVKLRLPAALPRSG
ncbi:MAG: hypothetical protein QM662_13060 [Gordonia sp. (in: high G+C Gram-positive bacteria)]